MIAILCVAFSLSITGCGAFVLRTNTLTNGIGSNVGLSRFCPASHPKCKDGICRLQGKADDKERELSNEECDILNLPYGTKIIGDLSERLIGFCTSGICHVKT